MADIEKPDLTTLTVTLLSAYVTNNSVENGDLARLIHSTHGALSVIGAPLAAEPEAAEHVPAVGARKSLGSREHILSMIDGKPYKSLKRHLSRHGLTPAEYRERYKLPATYPMVAPGYSEQRREVAARLGLGRRRPAESLASSVAESKAEAETPASTTGSEAPVVSEAPPNKARRAPRSKAMKGVDASAAPAPPESAEAASGGNVTPLAPSKPKRVKATTSDVAASQAKSPRKSATPAAVSAKSGQRKASTASPLSSTKRLTAKLSGSVDSPAE